MRKHHDETSAMIVRVLVAITYLERAVVSTVVSRHDPRRFLWHAKAALFPDRGEGLREAAEDYNARLKKSK